MHQDIQKIKIEAASRGQPHQAHRSIAERYAQEVEAWGDLAWQTFVKVFSDANVTPFPGLASNLKRWVEHEIKPWVTGLYGNLQKDGIHHAELINTAGAHALAKAYAEIDRFVLTLPPAAVSSNKQASQTGPVFIDSDRLAQLRNIRSEQFDLSRLIRLCEEADICYRNSCYHAVAMLTRAILDHVPPFFGFQTFRDVANQYNGGKSFKEIAQQLENFARNIADSHLHLPIRAKEVLPTQAQVNASHALDCILAEVVRLLPSRTT